MISSRPGCARKRRERRGDLVRVVREIVDDGDAAGLADRLQPAPQAFEPGKRADRILDPDAERARRGDRGERVRGIVPAGHRQPHLVPLAVGLEREG